ncbi:MAG: hypothetical protein L6R38_004676 [Xanthoria sp. 2 TBL-2021]|nr:MAG: hypothetical protein L6R38_004676 [Xanthoria sp. 2 TBL-2021]
MPRSKRAKVVHLTKTQKKGKELTLRLYANIRECIPQYPYIYVFSVENMRNNHLKDVRSQLANDSRVFFGKTRVMAKALGDSPSTEPYPATSLLAAHLSGPCGLIFSQRDPQSMLDYLSAFHPVSYARAGTIASYSFTLPSGMLYTRGGEIPITEDVPLAHSLEPTLRKLGLPTRLEKGRVMLDEEFQVCKEGEVLGSGQTTLLKMFGVAMAEFGVEVRAWWVKETGTVEAVEGAEQVNIKGTNGKGVGDMEMGGEDGDLGTSDDEE